MELKRFYVEPASIEGDTITISNREYRHIVNVLRYKVSYKLIVCCGDGYDYYSEIVTIYADKVICRIQSKLINDREPSVKVDLYAAMIKADNYELMVEKAVELGVSSITPLMTKYVNHKNLRIDRLNNIAADASMQSGRGSLVKINEPLSLDVALDKLSQCDLAFVAYENEKHISIKDILKNSNNYKTIGFIIGPEGGFSEEEIALCNNNKINRVTLGRRVLRAETASIAALSIIMYELDR